jgi:hypothetical protein
VYAVCVHSMYGRPLCVVLQRYITRQAACHLLYEAAAMLSGFAAKQIPGRLDCSHTPGAIYVLHNPLVLGGTGGSQAVPTWQPLSCQTGACTSTWVVVSEAPCT